MRPAIKAWLSSSRFLGPAAILLIVLLHASYIDNGYVWLDHGDIEDGRSVLPLTRLREAFVSRFGDTGFYRPLVTLAHSLDYAVYGQHALGFHVTNVLLHVAAAIAAGFFIASFVTLAPWQRWLVSLIFGAHILSMLPAGCISYRSEALVAAFVFLAVAVHARGRERRSIPLALTACLCLALSLLAKETAFFWAPTLIGFWELTRRCAPHGRGNEIRGRPMEAKTMALATRKGTARESRLFASGLIGGELLVIAALFLVRLHSLGFVWRIQGAPLPSPEAIGTRVVAIGKALVCLTVPFPLSLSDAITITPMWSPAPIVVLLVCASAAVWVISRRSEREMCVMAGLLTILLLPALNLVPMTRFTSPHYYYAAAAVIGFVWIRLLMTAASLNPRPRQWARMCLLAWLLSMAVATFTAGFRLRSDLTLFEPEMRRSKDFHEACFYAGNGYLTEGKYDEARAAYLAALVDNPRVLAFSDKSGILVNLAFALTEQGDYQRADSVLIVASRCAPPSMRQGILGNRAYAAAKAGRFDRVIELLGDTTVHWQRAEPLMILADALVRVKRLPEAAAVVRRCWGLADDRQKTELKALFQSTGP